LPGLIVLVLLVKPATILANGWSRAVAEILFGIVVIPLVFMGVALVCAIHLSKSRLALLYYPVIGGLIAAASVPPLIRAKLSTELFFKYGIVYGLVGVGIGGLAFLIRVAVEQHRTKDEAPGDSKEKS
jgi:hypothetical protein